MENPFEEGWNSIGVPSCRNWEERVEGGGESGKGEGEGGGGGEEGTRVNKGGLWKEGIHAYG